MVGMIIETKYSVGENVKLRSYLGVVSMVDGKISSILISNSATGMQIKYRVNYIWDGQWHSADIWEEELIRYMEPEPKSNS